MSSDFWTALFLKQTFRNLCHPSVFSMPAWMEGFYSNHVLMLIFCAPLVVWGVVGVWKLPDGPAVVFVCRHWSETEAAPPPPVDCTVCLVTGGAFRVWYRSCPSLLRPQSTEAPGQSTWVRGRFTAFYFSCFSATQVDRLTLFRGGTFLFSAAIRTVYIFDVFNLLMMFCPL